MIKYWTKPTGHKHVVCQEGKKKKEGSNDSAEASLAADPCLNIVATTSNILNVLGGKKKKKI